MENERTRGHLDVIYKIKSTGFCSHVGERKGREQRKGQRIVTLGFWLRQLVAPSTQQGKLKRRREGGTLVLDVMGLRGQ